MYLIFIHYHCEFFTYILNDGFDNKITPSKLKRIWIFMDGFAEISLRF